MDLAPVDFRFPEREAQRATAAPVKVISARSKLDAETNTYIRDLTQLIQNEARISELVPDVPAEVVAVRAKQGEVNSTRAALSAATQRKAKLDSDVSEIENGVIALANLQSEIETKTKNAIGGRYVVSQKEVRTITNLEKLTKNSASRIAKLKADSAVQDGLIKHLEKVKSTLEAEFVVLNRIATRATVMASSDVATQREINHLTTECDRLIETLVVRMRTIEKLNAVVANDLLRGTCPVTSYGYQPLRRLPNKAEEVVVAKEVDLTDKFFQVSTDLVPCEQKRDFAILASRNVAKPVKHLAITLPTTQSDALGVSSSAPAKVERVDPALVKKTRFALPKKVLEELREQEEDSEDLVARNVYVSDVIPTTKPSAQPSPVVRVKREQAPKPVVAQPVWDECVHVDATVELKEDTTSSKLTAQKVRPMIQMSCKDYHERIASLTRTLEKCDQQIPTVTRSVKMYSDAVAEAQRDRKAVELTMEPHLKNIQTTLKISRNKTPTYQLSGKTRSEVKLREIQDGPLAACNARITEFKTCADDAQYRRNCLVAERRDAKSLLDELAKVQPNPELDTEDFKVEYVDAARYNVFSVLEVEDDDEPVAKRLRPKVSPSLVVVVIEPFTEDMIAFLACEMNVPTEDPLSVAPAEPAKPAKSKEPKSKITITVDQDSKTKKCKTTVSGVPSDDLKAVTSSLKTKCATSCAVKDCEIIINGNVHATVKEYLISSKIAVSGNITVNGATTATSDRVKPASTGKTKTKDGVDRGLTKGTGARRED